MLLRNPEVFLIYKKNKKQKTHTQKKDTEINKQTKKPKHQNHPIAQEKVSHYVNLLHYRDAWLQPYHCTCTASSPAKLCSLHNHHKVILLQNNSSYCSGQLSNNTLVRQHRFNSEGSWILHATAQARTKPSEQLWRSTLAFSGLVHC